MAREDGRRIAGRSIFLLLLLLPPLWVLRSGVCIRVVQGESDDGACASTVVVGDANNRWELVELWRNSRGLMTDTVDTVPHVHFTSIMRCCRLWVRGWCLGPGSPWFWSVSSFAVRTIRPPPDKKGGGKILQGKDREHPTVDSDDTCPVPTAVAQLIWRLCRGLFFALFRRQQRGTRGLWFVRVWSRKGGEWLMPVSDGLSQKRAQAKR